MLVSILHRSTGIALSVGGLFLLTWFLLALSGGTQGWETFTGFLGWKLGPVPLIVLASLLGFVVGQTLNSWVLVRMKSRGSPVRSSKRLKASNGLERMTPPKSKNVARIVMRRAGRRTAPATSPC